ncbi:unnamed protein product [Leptidea sinapis]|uniref:Uncharacterized protein n=1 Tax=Leptidea sinapis TaxID=189913 RepID=A0A5E4QR76_9NEOP|nr:unnamed protein product [Leptidea sinapis]
MAAAISRDALIAQCELWLKYGRVCGATAVVFRGVTSPGTEPRTRLTSTRRPPDSLAIREKLKYTQTYPRLRSRIELL